jgi:hypothetical protein
MGVGIGGDVNYMNVKFCTMLALESTFNCIKMMAAAHYRIELDF